MNKGSCQCGSASFQFDGPYFLAVCHCRNCQKLHGSAFAPILHAEATTFRWLKGEDILGYFDSSPHVRRCFCTQCGSNLPMVSPELNHIGVPAGVMDTPVEQQPVAHFFVRSKVPWFSIPPGVLQYETIPPGGIAEVFQYVINANNGRRIT